MSTSARAAARLRLTRLPLVGTTVADVWAGFFCAGDSITDGRDLARLLLLHAAAASLYLAGMTLNDAFDARLDAQKHPERPIPSGALTRGEAFAQGFLLLAMGVGWAFLAGGSSGLVACALALSIVAYDGFLKRWAVPGALCMGLCRALDVQLGAGFARGAAFPPAIALGAYIFAATMLSTLEDRPGVDRARMGRFVFLLLRGIFIVDAVSLASYGHLGLAAATALLVLSVPAIARGQGRFLSRAEAALTAPRPDR